MQRQSRITMQKPDLDIFSTSHFETLIREFNVLGQDSPCVLRIEIQAWGTAMQAILGHEWNVDVLVKVLHSTRGWNVCSGPSSKH